MGIRRDWSKKEGSDRTEWIRNGDQMRLMDKERLDKTNRIKRGNKRDWLDTEGSDKIDRIKRGIRWDWSDKGGGSNRTVLILIKFDDANCPIGLQMQISHDANAFKKANANFHV